MNPFFKQIEFHSFVQSLFELNYQSLLQFKMIRFLIFSFLLKFMLSCQTKLNDFHNRYFYVVNTSPECTTFDFIKCQYTYCSKYITNSDGDIRCDDETTERYTQWEQCLSILCNMNNMPQTYETLHKCYEMNKKIHQTQTAMGISIGLFFVVVMPVIIFICYRDNRNCERWNLSTISTKWLSCKKYCQQQQKQDDQNKGNNQLEKDISTNEIVLQLKNGNNQDDSLSPENEKQQNCQISCKQVSDLSTNYS